MDGDAQTLSSAVFPLPEDVVAIITDYVYDTHKALSLVSRQWLHPARVHLFYSFHVDVNPLIQNSQELKSFAENFPEHLTPYIRELKIEWKRPHPPLFSTDRVHREPLVDLQILFAALHRLPLLHTLNLNGCKLAGIPAPIPWPHVQPLSTLALVDVSGDVALYNALLSHIPVLGTVSMLDSIISSEAQGAAQFEPDFHPSMPVIQKLVVESKDLCGSYRTTWSFYQQLLSIPEYLTSLDIGSMLSFDGMHDSVLSLILDRGRNLTYLRFDLAYVRHDARVLDRLNFSQCCPQLQVLHIRVCAFLIPTHSGHHEYGSVLCQFNDATRLACTASHVLHTVIIGIVHFIDENRVMSSTRFTTAEALSDPSRFPNLREVRLQAEKFRYRRALPMCKCATPLPSRWREEFMQMLPKMVSGGVLKFLVDES